MNNDLLLNSLRALAQNGRLLLLLLACVAWGTLLVFAILKKITGKKFSDPELTALALGGWPLPALGVSLFLLILRLFLPAHLIFVIALALITVSAGFALRAVWKKVARGFLVPVLIFLLLVFLRLGFIANLFLPQYFDSAEHYRLIQELLSLGNGTSFIWPAASYYHLGYHILLAAFTAVTQADLARAMLVFGQIILAAMPLPMYFLVRRATGSDQAAWLGVTLAAFGWFMPAHALNWGKYPALLSLLMIQFTLGAAVTKNRWLIALSAAASVLIHTRAAILLVIFLAGWILARARRPLTLGLTAAGLGMGILLIARDPLLGLVVAPYQMWTTLLSGLLAGLAFRAFPRLTAAACIVTLLILAGMFVTLSPSLTLLDRPLVEMILFLPLAFLGGLGSARLPKLVAAALVVLLILHAWTVYNFAPSTCCQLAGQDDMAALGWMKINLPVGARVGIASSNLSLTSGTSMQAAGSDAGIWVTPLIERPSLNLPSSTDFSQPDIHDQVCRQKITTLYVGGMGRNFELGKLQSQPAWYKIVFDLPKAQVVQVLGCSSGG